METLLLTDVIVDPNRFRRAFPEVQALADSIKQVGLIQPIVLDGSNNLIAGERRFRAHQLLGETNIKVVRMFDLTPKQKALVELEENIKRMPLTWQEECMATAKLHELYVQERGTPPRGRIGITTTIIGWRVQDTADLLGKAVGKVSQDIEMGRALLAEGTLSTLETPDVEGMLSPVDVALAEIKKGEGVRPLGELPTKDSALKVMKSQKDMAQRTVLVSALGKIAEITGKTPESKQELPNHGLKLGDCLEGMAQLSDGEVDLVLTDPPWGIEFDDHDLRKGAHGDVAVDGYENLDFLVPIMKECYRVLNDNSHIYVFFAFKHYQTLYDMMSGFGFKVDRVPLIWWKRNAFNQNPGVNYTHDYEGILFAKKGGRVLTGFPHSVLDFPPVSTPLKIHPTEKPLDLLKHLVGNSTIPGELVLDPFAGSGSTLRAAKVSGRRYLGWEKEEKHYNRAIDLLGD